MRHVDEQIGTHAVGDRAETLPVNHQRVRRCACDYHLGLVFRRQCLHLVVVYPFAGIQAVLDSVVQLATDVYRRTVSQVAAMRERHAKDGVARFEHRQIHRLVCLRSGVGLDIRVFRAEQRLGAVDRQLFHHVYIFAAAIVALAGIAFCILVGQFAALRFHHRRASVVFRRDQLDVILLTAVLILYGSPQLGVGMGKGVFAGEHGAIPEL